MIRNAPAPTEVPAPQTLPRIACDAVNPVLHCLEAGQQCGDSCTPVERIVLAGEAARKAKEILANPPVLTEKLRAALDRR
jgi:hypothetical protein